MYISNTATSGTDNTAEFRILGWDGAATTAIGQVLGTDSNYSLGGFPANVMVVRSNRAAGYLRFDTNGSNERVRITADGVTGIYNQLQVLTAGVAPTAFDNSYAIRVLQSVAATTSYLVSVESIIPVGITTQVNYFRTNVGKTGASTLTNLRHFYAQQGSLSNTITNHAGFVVEPLTVGTNIFGFRGQIAAASNRWNIYMDGTASNYVAGSLGIGSTSLTGYNLRVGKTITGATNAYAIVQDGVIQSDVTSLSNGYRNELSTLAAVFTLTNYNHYSANEGTIGAGSAITTQTGFSVASLNTGTNIYGFRSLISSGSNRWNLYMDGAAANYLNGKTQIGSTTDNGSGALLQVSGGLTALNMFNRQTASYTLVLTDQGKIVEMNVAGANNLTVPLNSSVAFPTGTEITILQYGAGQTTIVATGGVTLRSESSWLKIGARYTGVTLIKVGTDEWYVVGRLSA
jgi:hypothetical protein